ncbi:MAG: PDZ domain-containing protein [bacterium]|nr:PDZ domain-containing protein [bacterium]
MLISTVQRGTPAAKAGMQENDVILQVDGPARELLRDLRNTTSLSASGTTRSCWSCATAASASSPSPWASFARELDGRGRPEGRGRGRRRHRGRHRPRPEGPCASGCGWPRGRGRRGLPRWPRPATPATAGCASDLSSRWRANHRHAGRPPPPGEGGRGPARR